MANYVLAGGGTAGHVNPLIATAQAIRQIDPDARIVGVGTPGGLEETLIPDAGLDLELIERAPFPRGINGAALKFPVVFTKAVRQSSAVLRKFDADVVVGFGGYASTPMYLAARKAKIPVVVHEGNAVAGMANKLGARFAHTVALTFESTDLSAKNGQTTTVGLPLRDVISRLASDDRSQRRQQAAVEFGVDPELPTIVVTGGSLGAQKLNETMAACAQDFDHQVIHIAGKGKDEAVREVVGDRANYHVFDYVTDMDKIYALADLVITRAGAGMVSEVSALGIPAVFVPLPIGNGEQAKNAHDVVASGGALLVDNANFTPEWVRANIDRLMEPSVRAEMSAKARAASPLDAAQSLAQIALEISKEN